MSTTWSPSRRGLLQTVLAAGCAPMLLRHADAAREQPFALGLASGCPRPDRLVLWTRLLGADLPDAVDVSWELAEDEGFQQVVQRGSERAEVAWAHSVHAEPRGLRPDRWYWYRFIALGERSASGRTRTAPAGDAPASSLRLGIASCQRWDHGRYAAWRDMAEQAPDLVLFLGDYIYEYATPAHSDAPRRHLGGVCRSLDDYRQRYAQYKSDPQLQAMHAAAPWILTWDDHEVANDYAGPQAETLEPGFEQRRAAAAQAWWEHQPLPQAARPRGSVMPVHERYDWGRLARIIMLDDRQYRDPQPCPRPGRGGANRVGLRACPALADAGRSLLGTDQEQWLAGSWDARRHWNLLGQQTLMARHRLPDAEDPGGRLWTDGWDGYPAARQRLLRGLSASGAGNAVVLGGDVHANFVADLREDFDDPDGRVLATEFCATSISSHGPAQDGLDRARSLNPHIRWARSDQRGYMLFEVDARRLRADLRAVLEPWSANSPVISQARFEVAAGRPGAERL